MIMMVIPLIISATTMISIYTRNNKNTHDHYCHNDNDTHDSTDNRNKEQ